jgi:hypothetical protein
MTKTTLSVFLTLIALGATACGSSNNNGGGGPIVGPAVGPGGVPVGVVPPGGGPEGDRQLADYLINMGPSTNENIKTVLQESMSGETPQMRSETRRFLRSHVVIQCQNETGSCVVQPSNLE